MANSPLSVKKNMQAVLKGIIFYMSFSEDSYYQEKFSKISAEKETIKTRIFEECEFANCIFVECIFDKCKFIGCHFNDSILSAGNPLNSTFINITFVKSRAIGFDWTKALKVEGLFFDGCQINYSNFKLLKLPKIKIINSEAIEVEFAESDLSSGDFKNTNFENSRFFKTNLSGADFRGAKNYFIDVKNNTLKKAYFSLPEAMVLLDSLDIIVE
jgi:fluoroquinolone resistance protein